ncbi:hypothetical protein WJX74_005766 [Apatococcus lobatus]|uniref:Uncharacterized protein n=1 Tax=Apatococcus lobatus TaxID=904363 RepID=A0AAW1RTI4_9CHLO
MALEEQVKSEALLGPTEGSQAAAGEADRAAVQEQCSPQRLQHEAQRDGGACPSGQIQWSLSRPCGLQHQGPMIAQHLVRKNDRGLLEPLPLEDGKAALLDIRGPLELSREDLCNSSLEQFKPLLKDLVSSMRACLVNGEDPSGAGMSQQTEASVSQFEFVCYNACSINMTLLHELHTLSWESLAPVTSVSTDEWRCTLDALELSWSQKTQLVAACNEYLASVGPILHQQKASLGRAEVPLRDWMSRPSPACLRDICSANVEVMGAIKLEYQAWCQLAFVSYRHVFKPFQIVVLTDKTWPGMPDF